MAPVHDGPISSRHAPPSGEAIQVSRLRFSDVDHVAEATRHANVEMSVAGGQGYRGGLLALDAQGVSIQWGFHGLPMLARGQIGAGTILAQWKSMIPIRCNGQVTGKGLFFYPTGSELQVRTEGPCSWVSASVADLERHAVSLAPEVDLGGDSQVRYSVGTLASVCAVRSLLHDVRRAVVSGMDLLRNPEARRALAAELGAAMVRAVAGERPQRYREHLAACSALVRRADEYLRSNAYQPVTVSELCAALGTGEARLRDAFQRVYGVNPANYLRLRRLHLVRRKLTTTRREECTVSAAAASLGFFEFGRFAGEYRAMFGELPSQTKRAR